ncbi:hypothetical protein ES708_20813 [subsurface metagenome]
MSTLITPSNSGETTIVLQTRKGTPIPNSQSHEFSSFEKNQFLKTRMKHKLAQCRTEPNPIYNCHGLVFASGRTGITDNNALQTILEEDSYIEVVKDEILPGDIIIYYNDVGDMVHSGIVISKPARMELVPQVVSKWGKYKEMIHSANDCPYTFFNHRYYRLIKWD